MWYCITLILQIFIDYLSFYPCLVHIWCTHAHRLNKFICKYKCFMQYSFIYMLNVVNIVLMPLMERILTPNHLSDLSLHKNFLYKKFVTQNFTWYCTRFFSHTCMQTIDSLLMLTYDILLGSYSPVLQLRWWWIISPELFLTYTLLSFLTSYYFDWHLHYYD